jgi:hypothetical protein
MNKRKASLVMGSMRAETGMLLRGLGEDTHKSWGNQKGEHEFIGDKDS